MKLVLAILLLVDITTMGFVIHTQLKPPSCMQVITGGGFSILPH